MAARVAGAATGDAGDWIGLDVQASDTPQASGVLALKCGQAPKVSEKADVQVLEGITMAI
jgi:hypothetical protein